jgi:acyl-CoA thioester hydrolase
MKPPSIPLQKIEALRPICLHLTIPESYRDANGHMNVRWYMAIFDDAGDTMHEWRGLTPEYHREHGTGTFDLEHHIHYLNEVLPGHDVAVYIRFLEQTEKRLHYIMFLVNQTRGKLAATFECLNTFADLSVRRTAPWPPEIAAKVAAAIAVHSQLDWDPPLSGSMRA